MHTPSSHPLPLRRPRRRGPYRKLPDEAVVVSVTPANSPSLWHAALLRLHEAGYGDAEIAIALAEETGQPWTRQGVAYWRRKLGLPTTTKHPRQKLARLRRLKRQLKADSRKHLQQVRGETYAAFQGRLGWPDTLFGRLSPREAQVLTLLYEAGERTDRRSLTRQEVLDGLRAWAMDARRLRYVSLRVPRRKVLGAAKPGCRDPLRRLLAKGFAVRVGVQRVGKRRLTLYATAEGLRPHVPPTKRPRTYELSGYRGGQSGPRVE